MRIEKKAWPELFQKVLTGEKTADLRLADFPINPGDTLILKEWNPATQQYTGRVLEKHVTYVLKTKDVPFFQEPETQQHGFQLICFR